MPRRVLRRPGTALLLLLGSVAFVFIIALQVMSFLRNPVSGQLPELYARKGSTWAWWAWNTGSNKPRIVWNGEEVLEISAWASDIRVGDQPPTLLWMHAMSARTGGDSLFASYHRSGEYLLEQRVILEDETRVRVQFYITPFQYLPSVQLRLGHYRWYWQEATLALGGEVFLGRDETLQTTVSLGPNLKDVTVNRTDRGVNYFDVYYSVAGVAVRTLMVDEVIEFRKAGRAGTSD